MEEEERELLVLNCVKCGKAFEFKTMAHECPECDGLLWFKPNLDNYGEFFLKKQLNTFWDYKFSLPTIKDDFMITLGEGGTVLRSSKKLGDIFGISNLYFKDETQNPTSSFKDRSAALLISHARSWGYQKAVCASNGNQGASIAAYTSLEGMECTNLIPENIDIGKRAQMIAYNSKVLIEGKTVDDVLMKALDAKFSKDFYQCTPDFNPLTMEGQKTIAFEIFNQLGVPDWIIVPMGSGGLLVSIHKGFSELQEAGITDGVPKLIGVQSQACTPIVDSFLAVATKDYMDEAINGSNVRGLLVKNPAYMKLAIKALKDSKGSAIAISEKEMLISSETLARNEGIFAEPASALTIAALNSLIQQEKISKDESVVCLITGSGLKAPYVLEALSSRVKTAGMGAILSTKLKILSHISVSQNKGIYGKKLKELIGSISLAAVYQHLKELESKNLIVRKKEGKNVLYFITTNGKKVLEALDILITLL